ncbi:MAG: DUF4124 domain-containing protein [Myxococcaceae bacterium]|nr:DUF4124 domain-containing protein [Myxococcaceae bacterium]
MRRCAMLLVVAFGGAALAEVYTWTDPDGTVHYTDNPAAVPPRVKAKTTTGAEISTVSGTAPAKPPTEQAGSVDVKALPAVNPSAPDPQRIEREWRAAFRDVGERQARLEDEIEVDRRKVEDVGGLPVAARFQCFNTGFVPFAVPGQTVMVTPGAVGAGSQVTVGQGSTVAVGVGGQPAVGVSVGGGVVVTQSQFFQTATPGVFAQPCVFAFNPEYERAKERLELNRKALARVKAEAADLERRASFEGVPREWRR